MTRNAPAETPRGARRWYGDSSGRAKAQRGLTVRSSVLIVSVNGHYRRHLDITSRGRTHQAESHSGIVIAARLLQFSACSMMRGIQAFSITGAQLEFR